MADAVVVGSGINSLACAALLARGGWSVRVLEREDELGGCIRTAELTEPGFVHDVFSAWHPLWVGGAAHAELADELAQRGLEYLNTDYPTATLTPEGEATFLLRSTEANVAEQRVRGTADPQRMPAREHVVVEAGLGDLGRADAAAEPLVALEHDHVPAGPREEGAAGERVDPAADDDGVEAVHDAVMATIPLSAQARMASSA